MQEKTQANHEFYMWKKTNQDCFLMETLVFSVGDDQ